MSGYNARVLADSISEDGARLTTLEATFPRPFLAEFNTHRMLSRNSASSRAIPPEKQIEQVRESPWVPTFGRRVKGMGQGDDLTDDEQTGMQVVWRQAADEAADFAELLLDLNADKSHTNRILEPFLWHTVIVSATEWGNFFALRCHKDAAPEIRQIAVLMREALDESQPVEIAFGDMHLPLIDVQDELADWAQQGRFDYAAMVSVGRCARVSYMTHGKPEDPDVSYERAVRLSKSGHWSPFEHVATPALQADTASGNFVGWTQYRKLFWGEDNFALILQEQQA